MVKKRTVAFGSLIVAGVGYVAGVLTAPKSGKETRKDIKKAAISAKNESERKLKQAHSELTKLLDEAGEIANKSKEKVSEEFAKARSGAEQVRQKTRVLISAIHEGEAQDKDLQHAIDEAKKATSYLKKFVNKKN